MNPFDAIANVLRAIKGNRTRVFVVLAALAQAFYGEQIVGSIEALGLSTDQAIDALIALNAAAALVLRQVTTTPPGQR